MSNTTDKRGRFPVGNTLGKGGRREGSGQKTKEVRLAKQRFTDAMLPKAKSALEACLASKDDNVRLAAAKFIIEQKYGKAAVRVAITKTTDITISLLRDDPEVAAIAQESERLLES